jgi:hypothetical protein
MEFRLIKENEDGSADYTVNLSTQEQEDIIRSVILKALFEAAKDGTKYDPSKLDLEHTTSGGKDSIYGEGIQPCESGPTSDGFKTSQVLG